MCRVRLFNTVDESHPFWNNDNENTAFGSDDDDDDGKNGNSCGICLNNGPLQQLMHSRNLKAIFHIRPNGIVLPIESSTPPLNKPNLYSAYIHF